ncbi:MAG: ribbon-helix-helix domain-containing protein [Nanoarchaeota archaeon]|nr:ribbon-helix-helix domain-containing protein [Nanoarchaeota archaeon]MBU1854901.1 ribbon-helix-helix domain-containing protein [Nanoarchaeota archaeon]
MVTEMITLKLDDSFLLEIDKTVRQHGYQNRTEFIRNALREKVEESKLKDAMIFLAHLKGAAKKKTTDKEYEQIRTKAFEEISKKLI